MPFEENSNIGQARRAAIEVLLHNVRGGRGGLPRTAGWGYPEPYTRDLMIGSLGVLVSGNEELVASLGRTLLALAGRQTTLGLIPGIADEGEALGASDTTPLFLIGLAAYRAVGHAPGFLDEVAQKALLWCEYESPQDRVPVAQRPSNQRRDEQWVPGQGLYVNALVHCCLVLFGRGERAQVRRDEMRCPVETEAALRHASEGLALPEHPYSTFWSCKQQQGLQFDLLGNSIAILSGATSNERAVATLLWLEETCKKTPDIGELAVDSPPNLIPAIQAGEADWRERDETFNRSGEYHNGGIWPFVCGFHVAALVAAGQLALAEQKLLDLTELCRRSRNSELEFGFNEWLRASDGLACGQDWQFGTASMYLYAAACVETGRTPLFEAVRTQAVAPDAQTASSV